MFDLQVFGVTLLWIALQAVLYLMFPSKASQFIRLQFTSGVAVILARLTISYKIVYDWIQVVDGLPLVDGSRLKYHMNGVTSIGCMFSLTN